MKKFNLLKKFSIVLVASVLFVNCTNDDDDDITPVAEISFSNDIQPILTASCTMCHSSDDETVTNFTVEGGISYQGLLSEIGGVTAGNPSTSDLMDRLNGTGNVGQMPMSTLLSEAEIKLFEEWINEGALNN